MAVHEALRKKGHLTPWNDSPIFTAERAGAVRRYEVTKLLTLLTSRRVEYSGPSGCYFVQARSVYPWSAEVIADGGRPPNIMSMDPVRPQSTPAVEGATHQPSLET